LGAAQAKPGCARWRPEGHVGDGYQVLLLGKQRPLEGEAIFERVPSGRRPRRWNAAGTRRSAGPVTPPGFPLSRFPLILSRDSVSAVTVLLQRERLKIAARLPEADTLRRELLNFNVKLTAAGNDTLSAWSEGEYDELALAVWTGENFCPRLFFVD